MLGNGFTGMAISGDQEKQVYYLALNDFCRLKFLLNESFPAVLGKLEIIIPELKGASFQIEQSLYDAKTHSLFGKDGEEVRFESYVSADEDLAVIKISYSGEKALQGSVDLKLPGLEEFVDNPPEDRIFPSDTDKGNTPDGIYDILIAFNEEVDIPAEATAAFTVLDNFSNDF
jgi:hypothetical protein